MSKDAFSKFAAAAAARMGSPWAFYLATFSIVVWALAGPALDFSDTWQLIANTGTTLITFMGVFLIQATQNRDARAIHLKLDELICSSNARNSFAKLEDASNEQLLAMADELKRELGERKT